MSEGGSKPAPTTDPRVSFYPAWCKACGNCVAFCPREALARDQWGHPLLAHPERCTACGLCELLCPDFAISVGEPALPRPGAGKAQSPAASPGPERLAPEPGEDEENHGG